MIGNYSQNFPSWVDDLPTLQNGIDAPDAAHFNNIHNSLEEVEKYILRSKKGIIQISGAVSGAYDYYYRQPFPSGCGAIPSGEPSGAGNYTPFYGQAAVVLQPEQAPNGNYYNVGLVESRLDGFKLQVLDWNGAPDVSTAGALRVHFHSYCTQEVEI